VDNLSVDTGGVKRLKGESKTIKCESAEKAFGKVIDRLKKPVNPSLNHLVRPLTMTEET